MRLGIFGIRIFWEAIQSQHNPDSNFSQRNLGFSFPIPAGISPQSQPGFSLSHQQQGAESLEKSLFSLPWKIPFHGNSGIFSLAGPDLEGSPFIPDHGILGKPIRVSQPLLPHPWKFQENQAGHREKRLGPFPARTHIWDAGNAHPKSQLQDLRFGIFWDVAFGVGISPTPAFPAPGSGIGNSGRAERDPDPCPWSRFLGIHPRGFVSLS